MTKTLIIGNKNLSSWSLRPWILMKVVGIPFEEVVVRLDIAETRALIAQHSPSGLVPCLKDGATVIWDSLAIAEYLHEQYPDKHLWPADPAARTQARCLTAEMHAGFATLRQTWPMDMVTQGKMVTGPSGVRKDLARIFSLWSGARQAFGAGGAFLFGKFSIADAFFAPVISRIKTYGPVPLTPALQDYVEAVWSLPAYAEWRADAAREVRDGWYAWPEQG